MLSKFLSYKSRFLKTSFLTP
jgi:RNA recognition motif-containing protein